MVATDEDALTCDFAEVYRVYNWRELPPGTAATLAVGLSESSRIKRKMMGLDVPLDTLLLALVADRLALLLYRDTQDARRGTNAPPMISEIFLTNHATSSKGFSTPEEFFAAWNS